MRIAVVGGGLAGLTVALGCERAGHEVDLYEASDRLGGRMGTRAEGDHLIDLGFHVLHTAYPPSTDGWTLRLLTPSRWTPAR